MIRKNLTASTDGPTCPVCKHEITPDDSFYYDDMRYTEETCPECKTKFRVEVFHQTTWSTWTTETPPPPLQLVPMGKGET